MVYFQRIQNAYANRKEDIQMDIQKIISGVLENLTNNEELRKLFIFWIQISYLRL